MNKTDCIIIDLEGTLSNCSHRIHYWGRNNFYQWNDLFHLDTVHESMVEIINRYRVNGVNIILCTAKSVLRAPEVMSWLKKNELLELIDQFYFRKIRDSRPSPEIKKEMLRSISEKFNILIAFDDRPDICEMYDSYGIPSYLFIPDKYKTPADFLEEAAEVFKNKSKEYGNSYKTFGKIMMAFFPDGLKLETEKDFTRFAILNIMISKADRYCKNFNNGGHPDSLLDLSIYSTMLKEIDQ